MANPQLENGFTQIANELYDVIIQGNFNGTQYKIIQFVLRRTYGFKKKQAELSESFIAKGVNVHRITIAKELKRLVDQNVIKVITNSSGSSSKILAINKDYE